MTRKIIGKALPDMPWQEKPAGCIDAVWRYDANPVIGRNPLKCSDRVFNSALIPYEDGYIGVFRADHKDGLPNLHLGRSKNGIDWDLEEEVLFFQNEDGTPAEQITYGYDPRLVKIDDSYYITWCNNFHGPTIGVARTSDFKTFIRMENAYLPFNRNGVLFPRKINGNYVMLNRPSDNGHTPFGDIFLSESPDMVYWGKHRHVMATANNWWKATKIGPGPIPIETSEGWLMIYHGVTNTCNGFVYSMGAALLDIDNPSKVIADTTDFILTPQMPYEEVGFVPNVAFPCASVQDADTGRIAIFYGAADTYCAIAFTTLDELVDFIHAHPMKLDK
ncbi:MAG: glycoside hydrolase family 130 protein [Deltaproteobacteria bacterium]|nr:glycoside hydrolase family 130 protein [Deltaproteobacteria bacterium]MBN2673769.1 glycoside hydrolase family 130 protein [Deltaproteobacteria bacterium]